MSSQLGHLPFAAPSSETSFLTSSGIEIHESRFYTPTSSTLVVFHHGLGRRAGLYSHLPSIFSPHEISLYAFDCRCHGRSGGGNVSDLTDFDKTLVPDLREILLNRIEVPLFSRFRQIFLMGHSLGSLVFLELMFGKLGLKAEIDDDDDEGIEPRTRRRITDLRRRIRGMICCSVPLDLGVSPMLHFLAQNVFRYVTPGLRVTSTSNPNKTTDDPNVISIIENDPLVQEQTKARTAKFSASFLDSVGRIWQYARNGDSWGKFPLLLVHGARDTKTLVNGFFEFVKVLRENANRNADAIETTVLTNGCHEILMERGWEDLLEILVEWMKKHSLRDSIIV